MPKPTSKLPSPEEKADFIPAEHLFEETAAGSNVFSQVISALTNQSLKTLVGPRGCGKTHMMRYAWLTCRTDKTKPFATYVSFNRYYRLEPLLVSRPKPTIDFHSWVLALIISSIFNSFKHPPDLLDSRALEIQQEFEITQNTLEGMIGSLERNLPLTPEQLALSTRLTIPLVHQIVDWAAQTSNRKRAILLLDDAALTLTPPFLAELLDIVRALKTTHIAPKISVYPGTTEYNPKFHAGQDHTIVNAWIPVNDDNYDRDMDAIATIRVQNFSDIPEDAKGMLRFAAFGVPRAYLTMLWEYPKSNKNTQQTVNSLIENHSKARLDEFRSLSHKVPKLRSLIQTGEEVLDSMGREIKATNSSKPDELQLICGFLADDFRPMTDRMFQLLIEAGLVYELPEVKHGTPERLYRRFIPHTASLIRMRALTAHDPGGSLRGFLASLRRRKAKHPIRKALRNYVANPATLEDLSFSLPECRNCGQPRLTDIQKFCHNCGANLVEVSTFTACLEMKLKDVPGLTQWQLDRIKTELPKLQTIQDFLALQDPAAELRSVSHLSKLAIT